MEKKDLQRILDMNLPSCNEEINETLPEDLGIIQEDGYRSCINWELRGKGYFIEEDYTYKELSDEELRAYIKSELKKINKK